MTLDQLESRMRDWLAGEYQAVIFKDEQGIVGYALYRCEPGWIYLRQFFVQANRRRRGVGRRRIGSGHSCS